MSLIRQTIHKIDRDNNLVFVISGKGNIYPVDLNHYCKDINEGDVAIVTKSISGWLLVDVENKYPYTEPLDVVQFPRLQGGDLNIVEYWHYRAEFDKLKSDRERNEMNTFLINLFREKYNYDPFMYRPDPAQATLEEYL